MITAFTDAGTLTFEPVGYIKQVLDTAGSPEDRSKLEAHIRARLGAIPRDLLRFSLSTEEAIDQILHPNNYLGML